MGAIKIIGRTIGIIILAIIVLVCAAWVAVHTPPVNRFLLAKITAKVESSIGAPVRIGKLSLGWTHLSVNLQDVVIFGREGAAQPPFFTVRRASAQVDFLPLFHKKARLAFVRLDQPVIRFLVDRNGNSNVPHPKKSNPHSNTLRTLLNLQVRDFTLRSGDLELREQKIPLSAELHNLQSQLRFDAQQQAYAGSIAYPQGTFSTGTLPNTEHGLHANFTLTQSRLDLHPVRVDFGHSRFDGNLQLTLTSPLRLAGNYQADLFAADVSNAIGTALPVTGEFVTAGNLAYQSKPNASFAETFDAAGEVRSKILTAHYGQLAPEIRDAYARYSMEDGNLRAWNISATTLGGALSGDFEMPHIQSHPRWQVTTNLRGASLSQLDRVSENRYTSLQRVRLEGVANISVNLHSSSAGTQVHARVAISNPGQRPPNGRDIPLAGLVDVSYDSATGVTNFGEWHLQLGATRLALSGALSRTAQLRVDASTTDLHQLALMSMDLVQFFRSPRANRNKPSMPPSLETLNGAMQFAGTISGRLKSPHIQGQLSAQNLQIQSTPWSSFAVHIQADPSQASFQNGIVQNGRATQINFGGQIEMRNWAFTAQDKIQFHSSLRGISIAQIERVAGKNYPVDGSLNANFTVAGSRNQLNGGGQFQIANASFWKQQVRALNGNVQLKQGSVSLSADAQMPAGQTAAKLNYSLSTKQFQASVSTAALNLSQIQVAGAQKFGLAGMLKASASAHGTIEQPSVSASLEVANLQVCGQSISQAQAHFQLAQKHAAFSAAASRGEIKAQLSGDLDLRGQYPLHAKLDVPSLSIGALLAGYSSSAHQVQGQTEIHGTVDGPIKNPAALHAVVNIPTLTLGYQSVHWALAHPLHAEFADSALSVSPTELKGTGTDLRIAGRLPIKSNRSPATLSVNGTLNLAALRAFSSSVQSSGQIQLNLAARGSTRSLASELAGNIRVVNASIFMPSSPVGLEKMSATFDVANERITIKQFDAQVGGGTLTAQGSLGLSAGVPFSLSFQGNRIRIRYPQGIRSVLTTNLQFSGTTNASQLTGRVFLDELSFTQQFDMATVMSGFSGSSGVANPSPFMQHMKLNVSLQSTRELQLASQQLSMAGSANLNIVGTAADPVILGRLALTGGTIFFMGKRYQVQSGTVSFANPVHTEPVVDVYVQTTVRQYDITLNFVGPIERLRTNYTSVPPLSPSDIINLLAFGKTTEEAAAAGSTPASVGAESVVAQGVGSQVSGKLQNLTGLSQLTISPTAGGTGNQSGPGAQIGVQEQVTGSLLLTFNTDVTATQNTAVELQYKATQHVSVSVLRDQNGGYALDVRIRKSF